MIGAAAAYFLIYDESIDDDTPREDVDAPGEGDDTLPENPDDTDTTDPDTPDLSGYDTLSASENETVSGGEGRDLLNLFHNSVGFGDAGVDRLEISNNATGNGGEGQDRLNIFDDATGFGDEGPDILEAVQQGDASAFGGAGDDRITVSRGASGFGEADDDTMVVGRNSMGADSFILSLNGSFILSLNGELLEANDPESENGVRITDFMPAEDVLVLAGAPPSSIDVLPSGDSDTEIQVGFGNGAVQSIFLENVAPDDIDPEEILFTVVEGTPNLIPGGEFPFTGGDILDPTLGTDGADTVTTDQDAVIGTGAGDDFVTIGDGNTRTDTGADDDLLRVQGGTHEIDAGTGNDTVEGAVDFAIVDLGAGDDVASVTFDGSPNASNFSGIVDGGNGDDTIASFNRSDEDVIIRPGEGDDIVRTQGSATIEDVEDGDQITLTLRDGTEMINIDYRDATSASNPLVIELTDEWPSGSDLSLRVVDTPRVGDVYVQIGDLELIRLEGVRDVAAFQINVYNV